MRIDLALLLLFLSANALALSPEDLGENVFTQRPGANLPLDVAFSDERGAVRPLRDCLEGRPAILILGYYRCPMLCTHVSEALIETLRELEDTVGKDFDIIHISIDPAETPAIASQKRAGYLDRYRRTPSGRGWHFLTGDESSIRSVANAVGFGYHYDESIAQYAHPSGIVFLTPEGVVSSYLLGVDYPPEKVEGALKEAGSGRIGSKVERLLLLCYRYTPIQGKYGALVLYTLKGLGLLTAAGLALMAGRAVRRERRSAQ